MKIAALIGGSAIVVSAAIVGLLPAGVASAKQSGDASTTGTYVQPTQSAMTFGSTVTQAPTTVLPTAATVLVSPVASPTYKATAAAGCVGPSGDHCP